jgi:hypothetical protein
LRQRFFRSVKVDNDTRFGPSVSTQSTLCASSSKWSRLIPYALICVQAV